LALLKLRETSRWTAPDDLVFAEPRNGRRIAWTPTRRRYLAALKAAKLQRFSRFHDLRHSFASALAKAGRPERQIQEWCGHSSPSVTRKYMRSFAPEQAADLEAVDAAFHVANGAVDLATGVAR
jgi:integrase